MVRENNFNDQVIEEFRANGGKVGGPFEGAPMILVHHVGRKTKTPRVNPLVYQPLDDGAIAIFASKAGAPDNPDWYYNLRDNPQTSVEVGGETFDVTARRAEGEERDRIFNRQKERAPQFAEYEQKTDRVIPVIVLERA